MIGDDPEKRIAELERQLAELKAALRAGHVTDQPPQFSDTAAAAGQDSADERARRHAQAVWDGLRTGTPSGPGRPSRPEIAQLREAFLRAAADAGLSQQQVDDVLEKGRVTIKSGHSTVYSGGPQQFGTGAGPSSQSAYSGTFGPLTGRGRSRRRLTGADRFGTIAGVLGMLVGLCGGGAAALTAVFPSSALWMSGIVCRSPYHLVANTSSYSYKPGQSGTSVSYRCVSDAGWYGVNFFAIIVLQAVLVAAIVGGVALIVWLIRRRVRRV